MTRDEKVAMLVTIYVPDSLRLSTNKDAQLVSSALTVLIGAMHDSDNISLKGMAKDGRNALDAWESTIFRDHVAAEESDYAVIAEKASRAMPVVTVNPVQGHLAGWAYYSTSDTRFPAKGDRAGSLAFKRSAEGETYTSEYEVDGKTYTADGSSAMDAMREAVNRSGAMLSDFAYESPY